MFLQAMFLQAMFLQAMFLQAMFLQAMFYKHINKAFIFCTATPPFGGSKLVRSRLVRPY